MIMLFYDNRQLSQRLSHHEHIISVWSLFMIYDIMWIKIVKPCGKCCCVMFQKLRACFPNNRTSITFHYTFSQGNVLLWSHNFLNLVFKIIFVHFQKYTAVITNSAKGRILFVFLKEWLHYASLLYFLGSKFNHAFFLCTKKWWFWNGNFPPNKP